MPAGLDNPIAVAADKAEDARKAHHSFAPLAFGAIGVVFGDIGTSPLYSLQTVFSLDHNAIEPTPLDVLGIVSLVFWAITIVVTLKYVLVVMRADNDGEGGILALAALIRSRATGRPRLGAVALALGMVGAALFYGDSMITPAISVMSALEGLSVVNPHFEMWVLPLAVVIIIGLFAIQRWGTAMVGKAFAPIMLLWFVTVAVLGVPWIFRYPDIFVALSPTYAVTFAVQRPFIAFIAMGAVVLTITGAEALYADMGHFGRGPIRFSWFAVVLPALILNYLGQGAMILHDPSTSVSPFFKMAPASLLLPLVVLATLATVIASQAVISGAYSVTRQASRLGLVPRMSVKHTSREESGQIYMPATNWILFIGVLVLIAVFKSSANLAEAYGLAVTGTLVLTTILIMVLAHAVWRLATWKIVVFVVVIGGLELVFLFANILKIPAGGWLPLFIAGLVITLMTTWRQGRRVFREAQAQQEGRLADFVEEVRQSGIQRVPGIAVFPHQDSETTPLALRQNVDFNHVLHEHVVIVSMIYENVPHIRHVERVVVNDLGYADDGIVHFSCRVGFTDSQDVPKAFRLAIGQAPELEGLSEEDAFYFLSVTQISHAPKRTMSTWREQLFVWMAHNAASGIQTFHLPLERTVAVGAHVEV